MSCICSSKDIENEFKIFIVIYSFLNTINLIVFQTYGFSTVKTPPAAIELEIIGYKEGKQTDKKTYAYTGGKHSLTFESQPIANEI